MNHINARPLRPNNLTTARDLGEVPDLQRYDEVMGLHELHVGAAAVVVVEGQVSEDANSSAQLHVVGHDGVVHLPADAVQENVDASCEGDVNILYLTFLCVTCFGAPTSGKLHLHLN